MKKKLLAIILASALLVSAAGCGGSKGGKTSNGDNGKIKAGNTNLTWEEVKAKIPEKLKGTEITFYQWNEMSSVPDAKKVIDKFTEETGIKVNWTVTNWDDYATVLASKVATGESPDVVRLGASNASVVPYLMPLSDVDYDFTDQAWDLDNIMYQYQVNGKLYGAALKNTPFFMPAVCYYNRDLIKKYGLEDPYDLWKKGEWTWDKEMELCSTFIKKAGDQYQGLTPAGGGEYASSVYNTSLMSYVPEENKFVSHMGDANLTKGWQWMVQNINKGLVTKEHLLIDEFNNGLILFYHDSLIGARTSHYYHRPLKNNKTLGVVPLPCAESYDSFYQPIGEIEAYGIAKGAPNAEAVPYFLRYYLDASNYNMDKFYYDEQSAEVEKWCKEQKFTYNAQGMIKAELHGESSWNIMKALRESTVSQLKSTLDSYAPVVKSCVDQMNKKYSELK